MSISEHPDKGSILMCDFSAGFRVPEMDKNRPVIVLSPKIRSRYQLCTVVSLSMTPPETKMPYHEQIDITPPLPERYASEGVWIKGDMINSVGFHRLNLIRVGKDRTGRRQYYHYKISEEQLKIVKSCVLRGMGLSNLTKYL